MKKIRVAIFPHIIFESFIATFLDKDKFEIIPLDVANKDIVHKFGQGELYGDWCFPIKLSLAIFEKAIVEDNVEKIIGPNARVCSFPMIFGDLQKWIKKDFDYYPVLMDDFSISPMVVYEIYKQLKKIIPNFNFMKFLIKLNSARIRSGVSQELYQFYLSNLSLVRNPLLFKLEFKKYRQKFIIAENIKDMYNVFNEFKEKTREQVIRKKPKYKILLSGDISIIATEFSLFDLDVFLAKRGIEIINPGLTSKYKREARRIISDSLSSKDNFVKVNNYKAIESSMLRQILKGIDEKVDGIIYIKPNMCIPCGNLSLILNQKDNFNLPLVEITYDEHSGTNGVITRIEAFLNIISENDSH